jgi:hypothetical protein
MSDFQRSERDRAELIAFVGQRLLLPTGLETPFAQPRLAVDLLEAKRSIGARPAPPNITFPRTCSVGKRGAADINLESILQPNRA